MPVSDLPENPYAPPKSEIVGFEAMACAASRRWLPWYCRIPFVLDLIPCGFWCVIFAISTTDILRREGIHFLQTHRLLIFGLILWVILVVGCAVDVIALGGRVWGMRFSIFRIGVHITFLLGIMFWDYFWEWVDYFRWQAADPPTLAAVRWNIDAFTLSAIALNHFIAVIAARCWLAASKRRENILAELKW